MSYQMAMEAAGAEVLEYRTFGSYQGDWWARVKHEGREGWVNGYYGSCSGCDAFEGEFGYSDGHYHRKDGTFLTDDFDRGDEAGAEYISASYDWERLNPDGCEKCAELKRRLVEFGKGYLDSLMTQEEASTAARKNLEWDMDAKEMVDFIEQHPVAA